MLGLVKKKDLDAATATNAELLEALGSANKAHQLAETRAKNAEHELQTVIASNGSSIRALQDTISGLRLALEDQDGLRASAELRESKARSEASLRLTQEQVRFDEAREGYEKEIQALADRVQDLEELLAEQTRDTEALRTKCATLREEAASAHSDAASAHVREAAARAEAVRARDDLETTEANIRRVVKESHEAAERVRVIHEAELARMRSALSGRAFPVS